MNKIYTKVIAKYGVKTQLTKVLEELAELSVEISHAIFSKGDRAKIIEELSDVEIMLEQIKIIFEINETEVVKVKVKKLARLQKLLESEEEK
jgi:hypothetical protein